MRKLSADDAKDMVIITGRRTTKIGAMLDALNVGEALEILRADWKGKSPPYRMVNLLAKKPDGNL